MTLTKKDIILILLYLQGEIKGRTYLQKFIYLLNREILNNKEFKFIHYNYGPYSNQINYEISTMINEGIIDEEEYLSPSNYSGYQYRLTKLGFNVAKQVFLETKNTQISGKIKEYSDKFKDYSATELLRYVYKKYPEVKENSIYEDC